MSDLSPENIATVIRGQLIPGTEQGSLIIRELAIDSRRISDPDHTLFFALVTSRNDGHRYIRELFRIGVQCFVICKNAEPALLPKEASYIVVENTLDALQALAAHHRMQFCVPVIGITGSNGKTIIKEWLFQLLSPDKNVVRSPKSYNSQIGVPLSVWQMKPAHEIAVFEAGISEPDEMEKLQNIIRPDIGIFTNIGAAHDKNFMNLTQKAGEKLKLFTKVKTLIYSPDYFDIQDRVIQSGLLDKIGTFTWSYRHKADLMISRCEKQGNQTRITATYKSNEISVTIPFVDEASIENAIHCWALMLLMGYHPVLIAERMTGLQAVAMRLEMKAGINHCSVINDSYSSDLNSLGIALDFLNQQHQHTRRTVVLSDMFQSSLPDPELYAEIARLLSIRGVTRLIGIGSNISKHSYLFGIEKEFYESTDNFLKKFNPAAFYNETILIKGARIFEFEQISRLLQQKSHETVLEIDFNALVHNLNYFRSLLKPQTRVMAMVKAFSYGSGSFEIANVLQFHHVDYLAVAYADEGVELRKAGILTPVMVMNPEEESFDLMLKYNLEPEIFNFRTLDILRRTMDSAISRNPGPIKIHLKIDTGMHRLGFLPGETEELISRLREYPGIVVGSVFSHLAGSEAPEHDGFSAKQILELEEAASKIRSALQGQVMVHILNSAGISRFPDARFDMVRLGIGLYGIAFNDADQMQLQNVVRLRTVISQTRNIAAGESVGYGRSWIAERPSRIAVLPVGYADGLNRKLSNGRGRFWVNGVKAPVIGSICMDMCMIDITGIQAEEGDAVMIFQDAASIKQMAIELDTIPYEILTSVSGRVKRIYYYE